MPLHLNSSIDSDVDENQGQPPASWQSRFTRRSFLALAAAACACRKQYSPAPPPSSEQTWALISDTHIGATVKARARGSCMAANLRKVIRDVVDVRPDQVLFNGDVAQASGESADYATFSTLIAPLRTAGFPVHLALGNHDHRGRFCDSLHVAGDSTCPEKSVSAMVAGGVRWLLLDSLGAGNGIQGSLGAAQREWLTRQLDDRPASATIVCVHHNPDIPLVGLTDAREFLGIVRPRRQVKLVMFGHTHQYRLWQTDGLHFLNLPAAGYRFKPGSSLGWIRATTTISGIKLTFRGIDARQRDHGAVRELAWRTLT
jgi:3',5'-cyclic-AMP phosphodiesterase